MVLQVDLQGGDCQAAEVLLGTWSCQGCPVVL
jgi:hypothetical protein